MKKENIVKMVLAAMFLAMGVILPTAMGSIKELNDTILPMHLAALLCGVICGKWYGLAVGLLTPLMRSLIFSMPVLYPRGIYMALELAAYGFVIGFLYYLVKKRPLWYIYLCLISAQLAGRIVWALSKNILLGFGENGVTFSAFIVEGFVDALPGIALQLILIPLIVSVVEEVKEKRIKG